jgi:hypothetical protein
MAEEDADGATVGLERLGAGKDRHARIVARRPWHPLVF